MLYTFITVLAWLLFVGITVWIVLLFAVFADLTPYEQARAKITIPFHVPVVWLASLAWIITNFIS